ncbi:hypothetical protein KUTeg_011860 [Tegillarca granosa]|uniref:Uncharacterized protein n=1 Tax=Tegillarca granosa TaxID=220873 RepID=A0ABQ9EXW4_TEGGR|nr:hypothetical protein KUTeg_011860 [Tegillarca granosa]
MGVTLNPEDIDRSHRTGKPNPGRDRQVLVKFTRNNVKRAIMKFRWQLKQNTGYHNVYINEDLTKQRQTLYKDTRKLFYEKKATKTWTWDGKVFLLDVHRNKHRIDKHDDLNKFKSASSPSIASSIASQADVTVLQSLSPFRIVHYMMAYVVLIFKRNVTITDKYNRGTFVIEKHVLGNMLLDQFKLARTIILNFACFQVKIRISNDINQFALFYIRLKSSHSYDNNLIEED